MKLCNKCKQTKDISEFRKYQRGPRAGQLYEYCNTCYKTYADKATLKREAEKQKRLDSKERAAYIQRKLAIEEAKPKEPKNPIPERLRLKRVIGKSTTRRRSVFKK